MLLLAHLSTVTNSPLNTVSWSRTRLYSTNNNSSRG